MIIIPSILYAIIMVESAGNPMATNGPAKGLMQMTPIGTKEALIQCPELQEDSQRLLDGNSNLRLGACLFSYYQGEAERLGVDRTIGGLILYNGGYRTLNRYIKGRRINTETANYVLKVLRIQDVETSNMFTVTCTKRECSFKGL